MNCEKVRDVLIDYVKEELDEDTQKRVEEHLMICGECAREAHSTRRLLTATQSAQEESIINLANDIIRQGITNRASDIHLQAEQSHVLLRYRIDGVLHKERELERNLWDPLFTRLAIMADLNVTERQLPQEGRICARHQYKDFDLRMSYVPSAAGGKIVMRILDRAAVCLDFERLGLDAENRQTVKSMTESPNGIVLVTGPTGSGKTTVLYSMLNQVDSERCNVVTIEDPVEYLFDRVTQIGINARAGVTFPRAIRAVLRQDPDVIMVGEIRDRETVELSVQAALTGHLVMSTLHAQTTCSAVQRLFDIGVEPFLLQSSLIGLLAVRLVRRVCPQCKEKTELAETVRKRLEEWAPKMANDAFYRGAGCDQCRNTGYRGRIGAFEVMSVHQELGSAIGDRPTETELFQAATAAGMRTLFQDGMQKAADGITTVEEVMRVLAVTLG